MSIKQLAKGASFGSVKKGLARGSLLHFRLEETSGDVLTDDVVGAIYTRVNTGTLNYDTPNAVSHLTIENGGTDGDSGAKVTLANLGTKISALTNLDSGYLVLYTTADFHRVIATGPSNGSICAVTDFSLGGSFFIELLNSAVTASGREYGTGLDFVQKHNAVSMDDFSDGIYTNIVVIQFGSAPAFRYYDSVGNVFNIDDRTQENTKPYTMNYWDLTTALTMTLANCKAYTTGMLWLSERPSDEDVLEAARWHNREAPKGQKDVWNGWNKYGAAE